MAEIKGKHKLLGDGGGNCWHVLGSKGYDGLKVHGSYSYKGGETKITNISVTASKTSGAYYNYYASLWLIRSTASLSTVKNPKDKDNKYIKAPSEKIHLHDFANGTGSYKVKSKGGLTPGRWYFAMSCGQGGKQDLDGCSVGYDYFVIVSGAIEVYTKNGAPKISLVDNGNNSYTLRGTSGTAGKNNSVSSTLYRGSKSPASTVCSSNPYTSFLTSSAKIHGRIVDKAKHGNSQSAETYKQILYYEAPTAIETATINLPTDKTRWTKKDPFTVTWGGSEPANANSQIKGYRIYLYVNGTRVVLKNKDGSDLVAGYTKTGYPYYNVAGDTKSITIYPEAQGLNIGDRVKVGLFVWAENKKGQIIWSGGGNNYILYSGEHQADNTAMKLTNEITIQPAATMWIKINETTWKESESVWVKAANGWKEAESVWVKTLGGWKESQ